MRYPDPIKNLINNFASLPGIGQKTAERLVFYLLKKQDKNELIGFANNLLELKEAIKPCPACGNYISNGCCEICADSKRDKTKICLVAEAQDVSYLEKTGSYRGLYHILGGFLDPTEGITADKLNTANLINRLLQNGVQEIIMGFNPTIEGESTIIYLKKTLREKFPKIKITRLSRGLPMGGDLEYADEVTLSNAMNNRNEI